MSGDDAPRRFLVDHMVLKLGYGPDAAARSQ